VFRDWLIDAIANRLHKLPSVDSNDLPRMADFAEWGDAIGPARDSGGGDDSLGS
jgi:hypothetical protein